MTRSSPPAKDMAWIPGGEFWMGSNDFYPEERPAHRVGVDGFWIDEHPVTVAEFRRFVKATGYLTWAEQAPDPADYPGADPSVLIPGSLVFHGTPGPVDLTDARNWWPWMTGAQWRHPEGPGSTLHGRELHPVTHVAYRDAEAYAAWAGKQLPTEAQWEYAARGGLESKIFCWGEEFAPRGEMMANTWQGEFPWGEPDARRLRTSPVKRFRPNGYGLFDMFGNVWEWTRTSLRPVTPATPPAPAARRETPGRCHLISATNMPPRAHTSSAGWSRKARTCAPQLLPALPPRRAPRRGDRHHHQPHRVPLRRQQRRKHDHLASKRWRAKSPRVRLRAIAESSASDTTGPTRSGSPCASATSASGVRAAWSACKRDFRSSLTIDGESSTWTFPTDSRKPAEFRSCDSGRGHRSLLPRMRFDVYWDIAVAPEVLGVAVDGFTDPVFPPPMISDFEAYGAAWAMNAAELPMPEGHHEYDGTSRGGPRV